MLCKNFLLFYYYYYFYYFDLTTDLCLSTMTSDLSHWPMTSVSPQWPLTYHTDLWPLSLHSTIVSKPKEFAHLIKNKFGSADNIAQISKFYVGRYPRTDQAICHLFTVNTVFCCLAIFVAIFNPFLTTCSYWWPCSMSWIFLVRLNLYLCALCIFNQNNTVLADLTKTTQY